MSNVSDNYVTPATSGGYDQNVDPYVGAATLNATADTSYNYPAGMMNFSIS